jgi:beta-galactosidase
MRRLFIVAVYLPLVFGFVNHSHARESQLLATGWRFNLADEAGSEKSSFDDNGWQSVSLPHNWGWQDAQAGKKIFRGTGWYRRELLAAPENGKRFFLRFEAATLVADVYLNGKLVGEHRGGFGAFCFEISKLLSDTGTNLIAVRVDNSKAPDIAPLDGDFSVYGGLYRPVNLIVTGAENISLTDHGSPGVAWLQTSVTATQAVLDVTAQISKATMNKGALKVVARVVDADGKTVATSEQNFMPLPRETVPVFLRVAVPSPHLWNGRKDPYLYKAIVTLSSTNEVVLDSVEQPLGLRFYFIDPDQGFFLNGQPYHLHGADRHQDFMDKGWAISEADMDTDIALLKEIGATVVRCAHYQHSDYFYSQCDRAGILVWAEIPQVNLVHTSPEFETTSRNQLLDLIRQNINHPSIFAWSLFNEIGNGSEDPHRELQNLNALAHGEDPTRPTIAATMKTQRPQMDKIPDLLGWNIYPGWYSGDKEDYARDLDARRNSSKSGGFCVSEYGAGANASQHEQHPKHPIAKGQWHPEEWQAEVHEAAWAALKQRPFVWGTFVWCMFDFAVESRHEGSTPGLNDKGLVSRDRQIKKDAFYFYKANWSEEPMIYITSRRHTERTNAVTDIKIYSNAKTPELFVNGLSQGKQSNGVDNVFIWKNITLTPGENKIATTATANGQPVKDECIWKLSPAEPAK